MEVILAGSVRKYLVALSQEDRESVTSHTEALRVGAWGKIEVRNLRGDIKELKVKAHRLIFMVIDDGNVVYIVSAFKKQSQKTPVREIEKAEAILHRIRHEL